MDIHFDSSQGLGVILTGIWFLVTGIEVGFSFAGSGSGLVGLDAEIRLLSSSDLIPNQTD